MNIYHDSVTVVPPVTYIWLADCPYCDEVLTFKQILPYPTIEGGVCKHFVGFKINDRPPCHVMFADHPGKEET